MRERSFIAVYIVASGRNGTLYTGMTSDLWRRIRQHKNGEFEGFSKLHHCTRLVWYERHELVTGAIRREKQIKRWRRDWRLALIDAENPEWRDLSDWLFEEQPLPAVFAAVQHY